MRPPVLWADRSVEQIKHRLNTKFKETSQLYIREGFDDGMEQILQILGAVLLDPNQLARDANLAIIAQG
jgi:hypothetical protein